MQRRIDVANAREQLSVAELKAELSLAAEQKRFPLVNFPSKLLCQSNTDVAVMAEIKRASPSKGDIAPHIDAPKQVRTAFTFSCFSFRSSFDSLHSVVFICVVAKRRSYMQEQGQQLFLV